MKDLFTVFERPKDPLSVSAMRVALASPKTILGWSYGEVKKPGTVEGAIGRHGKDRTKMAIVVMGGKPAVTHYKPREHFGGPALRGRAGAPGLRRAR